jgi:hypothetical protein
VQRAFRRLKEDLDAARRKEAAQAASNKTFSPEELAERFPLFASLTISSPARRGRRKNHPRGRES